MNHMAGRKKHSAEDVVRKLRRADELAAAGKTNEEIAAELELLSRRTSFDVKLLNRRAIERKGSLAAWTGSATLARSGVRMCAGTDQLRRGQGTQLGTQRLWGGDDHRAQGVDVGRAGLDCSVAGNAQHPDGFDRIPLAALAADVTVRTRHLEHVDTLIVQVASQAGPVGAGSFDADLANFPLPRHPCQRIDA
jgi:hypothetical protein